MSLNIIAIQKLQMTENYISSELRLRPYQFEAIKALQGALRYKKRLLLSIAVGAGRTTLLMDSCKMFLNEGCARKILILTDFRDIEDQTLDIFKKSLKLEQVVAGYDFNGAGNV